MKKFNVNDYVYVKLTETGLNELRRRHEELKKSLLNAGEFTTPPVDAKGYSKFQMHVLMARFGHMMTIGFGGPFENDVLFDDHDLYDAEE